jgi:hypothetical protein
MPGHITTVGVWAKKFQIKSLSFLHKYFTNFVKINYSCWYFACLSQTSKSLIIVNGLNSFYILLEEQWMLHITNTDQHCPWKPH